MNILETTTYPNYQKSSVTSFKANETGGQTGSGSSILLGTVAAASAAVAGVALYKNHKTSKALKDTFTKLKETEINLNAAKDKIAETQKKLDEVSVVKEEEKTGKFGKKLKKTGKKAVKKTRKFFKKTGKKIGKARDFFVNKFKSDKTQVGKKSNKNEFTADVSDIINEKWLQEQSSIRKKAQEDLQAAKKKLQEEEARAKIEAKAIKTRNKIETQTEKFKSKTEKTQTEIEKKIEEIKLKREKAKLSGEYQTSKKTGFWQKIRNRFKSSGSDRNNPEPPNIPDEGQTI